MEIRTILVNFEIDGLSPSLLASAVDLAQRFDAEIIGHAAAEALTSVVGVRGAVTAARVYEEKREAIQSRLFALEDQFRAALPAGLNADWRGSLEAPTRSLVGLARMADLIITGSVASGAVALSRNVDLGDLVLDAGRPILAVGTHTTKMMADRIVVGWKDTREARRAVSDALPFLRAADKVLVATISEGDAAQEQASLQDCLAWLQRHGVAASGEVHPAEGRPAATLQDLCRSLGADLIVTGAYGHSRLREQLLGGMTRDLIAAPTANRFMSN